MSVARDVIGDVITFLPTSTAQLRSEMRNKICECKAIKALIIR